MSTVKNRFFVEGILLGGLCGVVLGSLIAFQVGSERVEAVTDKVRQAVRRQEPAPRYALIRQ